MAKAKEPVAGSELLTAEQVAERIRVCVRTLWRLVAAGKFPQPVRYTREAGALEERGRAALP